MERCIYLHHKLNEEVQKSDKVHPLSRLTQSLAFPDLYTQQCVNDAKVVFEEEFISFQLAELAKGNNFDDGFYDDILKSYKGKGIFSGEIL